MSYWNFNKRLYADARCADGIFSHGWRIVKKGGRVKAAGTWFTSPKLKEIEGELVHIAMADYFLTEAYIYRGTYGYMKFFCNVHPESESCP